MKIDGLSRARELENINERREQRAPSSLPPSVAPASQTRISTPGRLFSQLAQLSDQDPAAFKDVAHQIADGLRATIGEGSERGDAFAERLATRFDQAAEAGNLGSFAPPRRDDDDGAHHHHHHHRHHGGMRAFGEDVQSVLENALDLVHEALSRASEAPPAAEAAEAVKPAETTEPSDGSGTV